MIYIVRPRASRMLSSFYMNLGATLLYSHVAQLRTGVELIDLAFSEGGLAQLDKCPPNVILLSLCIDDFLGGLQIIDYAKTRFPDCVVVVGGPHATLLGALVFRICDQCDYVGVGDCLDSVASIIKNVLEGKKPDGNYVIRGRLSDTLAYEVMPDFSFWSNGCYFPVYPVEFSRGCPHCCPFCTDPVLRKGVQIKSVHSMLDEIRRLIDLYGARYLRFVDSSLTSLGPALHELLERIIVEDLPVRWGAYAHPRDVDSDLAELLGRAGCAALFIGAESFSRDVTAGKRMFKEPHQAKRAVSVLRDNGIMTHLSFIIGLPGENADTVSETLKYIEYVCPDSVGGGPFYLTPYSTFHRRRDSFGIEILDSDWILKQHESFFDCDYEYFRTKTLSQPQMKELAKRFRDTIAATPEICWNMSDFAVLCWLSVGGTLDDLKRLWKQTPDAVNGDVYRSIAVLKEKSSIELDQDRSRKYVRNLRKLVMSNAT